MVQVLPDRWGLGPALPYIGQALAQGITGRAQGQYEQQKREMQQKAFTSLAKMRLDTPEALNNAFSTLIAAHVPAQEAIAYIKTLQEATKKGTGSPIQDAIMKAIYPNAGGQEVDMYDVGTQPPYQEQAQQSSPGASLLNTILGPNTVNMGQELMGIPAQAISPAGTAPKPRQIPAQQSTQQEVPTRREPPKDQSMADRLKSIPEEVRFAARISDNPEDRRIATALDSLDKRQQDKSMTEYQAEQARIANEKLTLAKNADERAQRKADAQEKQFDRSIAEGKRKADNLVTKEYRTSVEERARNARETEVNVDRQIQLVREGKLNNALWYQFVDAYNIPAGLALSTSTEEFQKYSAQNIKGIRQELGGQLNQDDTRRWVAQYAGMANSEKGKIVLLSQQKYKAREAIAEQEALDRVFKENNNSYPANTSSLVEKYTKPQREINRFRVMKMIPADYVRIVNPETKEVRFIQPRKLTSAEEKGWRKTKWQ